MSPSFLPAIRVCIPWWRLLLEKQREFLRIKESELLDFARSVKKEKNLLFGPASIVCLAGFYEALKKNQIKNGETVLINLGEAAHRAKSFVKSL